MASVRQFTLTAYLMALRIAAILLLTPVLHAMRVPLIVRVLLALGLAAMLAGALPGGDGADPALFTDTGALFTASMREVAFGSILALSIFTAFAAASMAGRLLDVQVGFGIAQVFDPATSRQVPVITSAFNQVAALVFFLVDGHHALLRGIAFSFERFPPGHAWSLGAAAPHVLRQVGGLFALGFALAAPVVFCLLLTELALDVAARSLPQMNMFSVGLPLKVGVGLVALAFWFGGAADAMGRCYQTIYSTWDAVFTDAAFPTRGAR